MRPGWLRTAVMPRRCCESRPFAARLLHQRRRRSRRAAGTLVREMNQAESRNVTVRDERNPGSGGGNDDGAERRTHEPHHPADRSQQNVHGHPPVHGGGHSASRAGLVAQNTTSATAYMKSPIDEIANPDSSERTPRCLHAERKGSVRSPLIGSSPSRMRGEYPRAPPPL